VIQRRLSQAAVAQLADARGAWTQMGARLQHLHPQRQFDQRRQQLEDRSVRLEQVMRRRLERRQARMTAASQHLNALNPLSVLQRGYSIVVRADGAVVTSPEMVGEGERLQVRAAGGEYGVQRVA
jgi:exodeoxyribonuclease VII large subunit